MADHNQIQGSPKPPPAPPQRPLSRRKVVKIGALAGVSLPLIVTLSPTEARAEETGGS